MKKMTLKNILPNLEVITVTGNQYSTIKHVVTKAEKVKDYTLFFNLKRQKDFHLLRFNWSNVVMTDVPCIGANLSSAATIVRVGDISRAYWDFVQYYRSLFNIPVIGITGTCGKTTTTEMVKTIISKDFRIHSTYDGNNAWYLSLPYLLGIDDRTQAAVFEMGVGGPGQLSYICKHYQPQVGVLLNIGTYHLLGCKTQENYIKAKAELFEGLGYKGTLILNSDDKYTGEIDLKPFNGQVIYFGINNNAAFKARNIKYSHEGMKFTLVYKNKKYPAYVPGYGEYNVYNALAAIAAAHSIGIDPDDSIGQLASFQPVRQHMQLRPGINGCTIIDDTWNCTPPSMESALKVLKQLGDSKKTVAVLGYMPQLGTAGHREYERIGEIAAGVGMDLLITVGDEAKTIGIKALKAGLSKRKVLFCRSAEQLYEILSPLTGPNTLLLFKFPYKYRLSKYPSYREFMTKIFADVPFRDT